MAQTVNGEGAPTRRASMRPSGEAVLLEEEEASEDSAPSELDGDPADLQQMSEVERLEAMNQFAARRKAGLDNTEDSVAKAAADAFSQGAKQVMLPAKTESELPERSGWVKRMAESLGFLSSWEWRWLVLKDCRAAWFEGPDKRRLHGVIDFELVDVEIERLWDDPSTSEASRSQGIRRGKDRGCRAVCISGLFSSDEAYFRLLPVGSNRAFEFGVATRKEAGYWIDDLGAHLEEADRRCEGRPRLSAERLNAFQRSRIKNAWWKVSRISPETFKHVAETGDILLFKSKGTFPRLIRAASAGTSRHSRFDHVGLILRLEGDTIGILEATGNEGVGLCTWRTFLANGWQNLYPELALRRVRCPRSAEALSTLQEWVGEVIGKPYNLSVSKLRHRGSTGGGQQDFFCSQLVAEALKVLGVIPRGQKDSAEFWPSSFSARSSPIPCSPGCSFDPEDLTIDFSLSSQTATESGGSAKRDATDWAAEKSQQELERSQAAEKAQKEEEEKRRQKEQRYREKQRELLLEWNRQKMDKLEEQRLAEQMEEEKEAAEAAKKQSDALRGRRRKVMKRVKEGPKRRPMPRSAAISNDPTVIEDAGSDAKSSA